MPKKLGRWGLVVGAAALLLWAGYLNGTLDDVRMSCRAYSAEEVAALAAM